MNIIKMISLTTVFYKAKIAEGNNDYPPSRLEEENKLILDLFMNERPINYTFYNREIEDYQTNLISIKVFKNLPENLKTSLLNFCNTPLKKNTSGFYVWIVSAFLLIGAVVKINSLFEMFPLKNKNFFIKNNLMQNITNIYGTVIYRSMSPYLETRHAGQDMPTNRQFFSNSSEDLLRIGHERLSQSMMHSEVFTALELKRRAISTVNSHEGESLDDFICNYRNHNNLSSMIIYGQ